MAVFVQYIGTNAFDVRQLSEPLENWYTKFDLTFNSLLASSLRSIDHTSIVELIHHRLVANSKSAVLYTIYTVFISILSA